MSQAAGSHDYQYSSPAYQTFHDRMTADLDYLNKVALLSKQSPWLRLKLRLIAAILQRLGDGYWEVDKTSRYR